MVMGGRVWRVTLVMMPRPAVAAFAAQNPGFRPGRDQRSRLDGSPTAILRSRLSALDSPLSTLPSRLSALDSQRLPASWIVSYRATMFSVGLTGWMLWQGAQIHRAGR